MTLTNLVSTLSGMERITAIKPYQGRRHFNFDREKRGAGVAEAGFQIETSEQTITLAIDDEADCCESWGYFLTEDNAEKFVGAELRGVAITDTNRSTREFPTEWQRGDADDENRIHLDSGEAMFVDIQTDRGTLQFVAYNAHNGYYGHEARVSSKQLTMVRTL